MIYRNIESFFSEVLAMVERQIKEESVDGPCTCSLRCCGYRPCKGQCGCNACRWAYQDFLSCE